MTRQVIWKLIVAAVGLAAARGALPADISSSSGSSGPPGPGDGGPDIGPGAVPGVVPGVGWPGVVRAVVVVDAPGRAPAGVVELPVRGRAAAPALPDTPKFELLSPR